jgi:hypothetical protein
MQPPLTKTVANEVAARENHAAAPHHSFFDQAGASAQQQRSPIAVIKYPLDSERSHATLMEPESQNREVDEK